jgi:hypothetical protein
MSYAQPVSLPGHDGFDGDGPRHPSNPASGAVWAILAALAGALSTWWIGWRMLPILTSLLGVVMVGLLLRHPELSSSAAATDHVPMPERQKNGAAPRMRLITATAGPVSPQLAQPTPPPVLRVVARPASAPSSR